MKRSFLFTFSLLNAVDRTVRIMRDRIVAENEDEARYWFHNTWYRNVTLISITEVTHGNS